MARGKARKPRSQKARRSQEGRKTQKAEKNQEGPSPSCSLII